MTHDHPPEADSEARDRPGSERRASLPVGEQGLRSQVWVLGLVGIVAILLALFSLVL